VNLSQIARDNERAVLRAFNEAIQSVKDQAVIAEIAALINAGDVDAIVNLLQLDAATFRPLENAVVAAYEAGGVTGASQIGRIPVEAGTLVARFNVRSPRAEAWLRAWSSERIVEIADDTREVVRRVLTANLAEGVGPRTSALDLVGRFDPVTRKRTGGFIGLTQNQAEWVRNARMDLELIGATDEQILARFAAAGRQVPVGYDPASSYLSRQLRDKRLDGAVAKASREGSRLKAKQVDAAVSRYQARALRYRAETIARTESINALRSGQAEAIRQAVDTGELEQEFATKVWDSSGDARTRFTHAMADGQEVPIDQPFTVGGYRLMNPGDSSLGAPAGETIQCRCFVRYRMNFAGQAARDIRGFG
jgi:hypothetical protein